MRRMNAERSAGVAALGAGRGKKGIREEIELVVGRVRCRIWRFLGIVSSIL